MRRRDALAALGTLVLAGRPEQSGSSPEEGTALAPEAALVDEEIAVGFRGLPGGERVTVTARTAVGDRGTQEWSASATFRTREDGTVSLADQAPLAGDYEGVDPMGLFQSMTTDQPPDDAFFPARDHEVTLTATVDGVAVAETTVSRRFAAEGVTATPIDAAGIVGTVVTPPGEEPAPGVVLTHGSSPAEPLPTAKLLASRGFAALALQYFGTPEALPVSLSEIPVEYVREAIGAFLDHDRVAGSTVGFWGPSRGGELAVLVAAHDDRIGAVVGEVPSDVVWEGVNQRGGATGTSAWSLDGEPLPYIPTPGPDRIEPDADPRAYFEVGRAQAGPATVERARIPVEQIDAPVLLFSGADDRLWPGAEMAENIVDRLDAADHPYPYEHRSFEGAGHWLRTPYVPTYGMSHVGWVLGGTPAANARASREHWPALRQFFAEHAARDVDPETVVSPVAPLSETFLERNRAAVVGGVGLAAATGLGLLVYNIRRSEPEPVGGRETDDALAGTGAADGGDALNTLERVLQFANTPRAYAAMGVAAAALTLLFGFTGPSWVAFVFGFGLALVLVQTWLRFGWPRLEAVLKREGRSDEADEPDSLTLDGPSTDFKILVTQTTVVTLGLVALILLEVLFL